MVSVEGQLAISLRGVLEDSGQLGDESSDVFLGCVLGGHEWSPQVNEKRQAEGKPTVGFGAAADAVIERFEDISVIDVLTRVLQMAVVDGVAKCKTEGEINKCADPIPTPATMEAKRKRRGEIRAFWKAVRKGEAA